MRWCLVRLTQTTLLLMLVMRPASAQAPDPSPAQPPDATLVTRLRRMADSAWVARALTPREGVYLRIGGMTTGSGLALGPGYRRTIFPGGRGFLDVSAAISTKAYKAVDARVRWTRLWHDRLELWSDLRYRDYLEEDFFGIGGDSRRAARTSYAIESVAVAARGLLRLTPQASLGADLGVFRPDVGHGSDPSIPSIEDLFDERGAPGLTDQPAFVQQAIFLDVDTRDPRGAPQRGGQYRVAVTRWNDTSFNRFDHYRVEAEATHAARLGSPRHLLFGRVGTSVVDQPRGQTVPFYMLPYVGGAESLRGFREFRFRDAHTMWLNLEYRWRVRPPLDVVTFVDGGEVQPRWRALRLADAKWSYGVGLRVHTAARAVVRLDIGTGGGEGVRAFLKFGPSF